MEMHQLRYFSKVAETGNVTKAARACFVSQPSLSQQIAKLERELGQPLLERLGRGVRLTSAGLEFQKYAERILELADEARSHAADDPDAGQIVIAAIPTVAPYYLPDVLTKFARACPLARVDVVEETTAAIIHSLERREIDLAILALPVAPMLDAVRLFTEELVAVIPAKHRLARAKRVTMRDLVAEPFVLMNEVHCLTGATLNFCARHSISPVSTARIHQLATVVELVRLGHGVSLIPRMAARSRSEGVVYRSLSGEKPTRQLAVVWRRRRFQTRLAKRFVKFLAEHPPPVS